MRQAAQEVLRQLAPQVMEQVSAAIGQAMASQLETAPEQLAGALQDAFHVDAGALQDAIHVNMTEEELSALLRSSMASRTSTLDGNLQSLGYADPDEPSAISLYPLNFEAKEHVLEILDSYNAQMEAYHYESKTRGLEDTPEKVKRFNGEMDLFKEKWEERLRAGDPYYNVNLTLARNDFTLRNPYEIDYEQRVK